MPGFDAKVKLTNADLAAHHPGAGGKELAKGKADLQLTLEGQGFSPRGLLTSLSGTGELRLDKGVIHGLSPAVLKKAASTYMTQEIPDKAKLTAQLDGDFRKGKLAYRADYRADPGQGRRHHAARCRIHRRRLPRQGRPDVALAPLRLDSEWEVAYTGKTDDGQQLPPVQLVFAGPLAGFGSLSAADLDADQFERYLSIKRLDMDMDRLEKLGQQRANSARNQPPPGPRKETAPVGTIPTQSVLRAAPPPVTPDPPAAPPVAKAATAPVVTPDPPAAAPPTKAVTVNEPAPDVQTGWSTGVEAAGKDRDPAPAEVAPPPAAAQGSGDFEAQIREVLGNQQRPLGDTQIGGAQSYSRGGVKAE